MAVIGPIVGRAGRVRSHQVMTTTTLLQSRQPQRQRARQPEIAGDLRQQRRARVRGQARSTCRQRVVTGRSGLATGGEP
jgi:hypothetical protein